MTATTTATAPATDGSAETAPAEPRKRGRKTASAKTKGPAKKPPVKAEPDQPPAPAGPVDGGTKSIKSVLKTIPIDRIDADPDQPRKVFDPVKLQELAESMKKVGQLQAVSVRYITATKRYTLVMGERRWRAAKLAGLTEMHAMVMHGLSGGIDTFARAVAENVGRADMSPLEEAEAFRKLSEAKYSLDEIAEIVGKSANYVDLRMNLLKLTPSVQEALLKDLVPVGLAWYVSQLSPANQNAFLARWTRGVFSGTRDAEAFCQKARSEEEAAAAQSVMFVLADEVATPNGDGEQEDMFPEMELSTDERDQLDAQRKELVRKIGRLGEAGEILTEIAAMDPGHLALLLSGAHGGIPGNRMRVDHLKAAAAKASTNIRQAAAVASVRAGSLRVAPAAEAPAETATETATGQPAEAADTPAPAATEPISPAPDDASTEPAAVDLAETADASSDEAWARALAEVSETTTPDAD